MDLIQLIEKKRTFEADTTKDIEEVNDINGVIAFFEEKGESVSSSDDIEALKEKYNVNFPNLK